VGVVQDVFAYGIALGVVSLSVVYTRRQVLALRKLRETPDLPEEETRRERRQCWRRLVSSVLLLLIAALIVVAELWLERPAQVLADRDKSLFPLTDDERAFLRLWGAVWIAVLLLLFVVVVLALVDLWAIRRYSRIQHRKLRDDRRAMIARQLQRLRQERNGE
jgi:hypothetical protein